MNVPEIRAGTTKQWRAWLEKNHLKESKVHLILHKKHTGKPTFSHRQAMDEAICFGWIDTTIKRLDEDTFIRTFAKRNKNSKWSKNTLGYAKKLKKEGRMSPFGLKLYKEGLKKKPHDHGIPKNPDMPEELKKALNKNKKAKEEFEKLSPSTKRTYYRWILRAKLPKTKKKRVEQTVSKRLHLIK